MADALGGKSLPEGALVFVTRAGVTDGVGKGVPKS